MSGLTQKLLEAQKDMPALQKNAINPHFGNAYISLDTLMEQVLPILNKHGLILSQIPSSIGDEPALQTMIINAEDGDSLHGTVPLILDKDNSQGLGSAITYARRYALMAFLGLVADKDDDANAASAAQQRPRRRSSAKLKVVPGNGAVVEEAAIF